MIFAHFFRFIIFKGFVANIPITNRYAKYPESGDAIFEKFNRKYPVDDENPGLLKGRWKYTKPVIIGFFDKQALKMMPFRRLSDHSEIPAGESRGRYRNRGRIG